MKHNFISVYKRLLKNTNFTTHRYLFDQFNTDSRLTGLVGPRGTGKTTLLLQYISERIKNKNRCIYLSLDHIHFTHVKLVEFVDDLYEIDGIRDFFFDEVHKYPYWNQELKNIYDSYPDVKIVFSGSSSMDLIKGTYDLSRRGSIFRLPGMSFREYLEFQLNISLPVISFENLLKEPQRAEHFGISIVEAMACQTIPLVYRAGGPIEIVNNNDLLWSRKRELKEKSIKIIEQYNILKSIKKQIVKRARQFSQENFFAELDKLD